MLHQSGTNGRTKAQGGAEPEPPLDKAECERKNGSLHSQVRVGNLRLLRLIVTTWEIDQNRNGKNGIRLLKDYGYRI
jgi:hypothetical protein